MIRISLFLLVLGCAFAQYPQPHAGWKLVPGAENLISGRYWDSTSLGGPPTSIQTSNGVLQAKTPPGSYFGNMNPLAPRLQTTGSFGVVATFLTAPGANGMVTITGSLNTGAQYWQGMTEVEFGLDKNGNYVFAYWDGTSANPASYNVLKSFSSPPTGAVTVELLHQQGQFLLFFNGVQYGPFNDPGLFTTGYVMPGFELFPDQQMQMTQFAFEVPTGDTTAQLNQTVGAFPFQYPGDSPGSLMAVTGRIFGTQVSAQQLALGRYATATPGITSGAPDPTYAPKVVSEFDGVIAAAMYYFLTETAQGVYTFADGDALIADAKSNNLPVHCHQLIGPNLYLPAWLVNGTFTAAQLTQILQTHVQTVVDHFKGQCASWDVVNEALNSDGTISTTANVWAEVIGPSYIDLAFEAARKADPTAKLYYNEYYVEDQTPKTTGLYLLISGMQQRGVPIDGVGLQCHWIPGNSDPNWLPNHDEMVANMGQLAKMGLTVRLSELDARLLLPASAADLANQATIFSTTVQACLDSPNCTGVWFWGADDDTSWIPSFFPGYGAGTMFDANFKPKPGYTAVINTLRAATKAKSAITNVLTDWGGPDIAQDTFIAIKGTNLVPATTPAAGVVWSTAPSFASGQMPTALNGVSVTVNGKPAFVYYFCSVVTSAACTSDQINVLTPLDNSLGPVKVVVTNGTTSTPPFTVNMNAVVPTFLLFTPLGAIVATHITNNYSLLGSAALYPGYTTPARPGETVVTYAVGFGLPTTSVVNGSATQTGSLPSVPVCQIGGQPAVTAAALIAPGLYLLDLTVPPTAPSGDNPVTCTYGGATTQARAFITVQQ